MGAKGDAVSETPLKVLPLGGLGEIGMNCMLVGRRGRWVMVDCGVQFPDVWELGAERKLPDLGLIESLADQIEAVVITHGHEDHIGALPWVLPRLNEGTPLWASSFTEQLIRRRLTEHGQWFEGRVQRFVVGERFQAGPFEIEGLRVTHSLPDCASLVMRSEDGTVLHTGDWKIDETPMDGEHFDRAGFERVGREGVTLMLSDSTNIRTPGRTRSEREVGTALRREIEAWEGRVIVTMFASNLHRLRALVEAAEATGRKVAFAGRSLWSYLEAAWRDGRAPIEPSRVVDMEYIESMDPREALVVTTGSQGERNASLGRAAEGEHPKLVVGKGDLVLHSARVIPGNEARAYQMFNQLGTRGAKVIHGSRTDIHTSGHAQQDELRELLNLVKPQHFVPVHGEYTFLQGHAELARLAGRRATVLQNGETLAVTRPAGGEGAAGESAEAERVGMDTLEVIYNDGPATGDRAEMKLSERLRVAWNGVVVVDLTLEREPGGLTRGKVAVETRAMWTDDGRIEGEMVIAAERAVHGCPARTPFAEIQEVVRAVIRRIAKKRLDKRPDVIIVAHEGRVEKTV